MAEVKVLMENNHHGKVTLIRMSSDLLHVNFVTCKLTVNCKREHLYDVIRRGG